MTDSTTISEAMRLLGQRTSLRKARAARRNGRNTARHNREAMLQYWSEVRAGLRTRKATKPRG